MYKLCDDTGKIIAERNNFRYLKQVFDTSGLDSASVYCGKKLILKVDSNTTCKDWNRIANEKDDF